MTRPGDRPEHSRIIPRRPMTVEQEALEAGHELRDMRLRQVIRYLALLTVAVIVVVAGITLFQVSILGGIGPLGPSLGDPPRVTPPPEPRLESVNGETLRALRQQEDQALNNYTWVDQAAGTVRLPVDRAIELTLERGLPARAQDAPQAARPQGSNSGRSLETTP